MEVDNDKVVIVVLLLMALVVVVVAVVVVAMVGGGGSGCSSSCGSGIQQLALHSFPPSPLPYPSVHSLTLPVIDNPTNQTSYRPTQHTSQKSSPIWVHKHPIPCLFTMGF